MRGIRDVLPVLRAHLAVTCVFDLALILVWGDVYKELWSGEPLNYDDKSTFYLVYFSKDDKPYGVTEQYGNGELGSWATVKKVCRGY